MEQIYSWSGTGLQVSLCLLGLTTFWWSFTVLRNSRRRSGQRRVPLVGGGHPLVGHGILLMRDWLGFLQNCFRTYGPIFQIRIWFWRVYFVCDRDLALEAIKSSEITNTAFFESLKVSSVFYDDPNLFRETLDLVHKSVVALRQDAVLHKIQAQALKVVERIRTAAANGSLVDLNAEMIHFIFHSTTSVLFSVELTASSEVMSGFANLSHFLGLIIQTAPLLPGWLVRLALRIPVKKHRARLIEMLMPYIRHFQKSEDTESTSFIRLALDHVKRDGSTLTDDEVGGLLVHALWLSTGQTNVAITNLLLDLANNPSWLKAVREECHIYLSTGDLKGLCASRLIQSCVMESARLNSSYAANIRYPEKAEAGLSGWWVGDADAIFMAGTHVMDAGQSDPNVFNPDRKMSPQLLTWGKGAHSCSGKLIAFYQIKVMLAVFLAHLDLDMERTEVTKKNFSAVVFLDHGVSAAFKPQIQI